MTTIHDILAKPAQTGPCSTSLGVKVIETDGKKTLRFNIADGQGFAKATCTDRKKDVKITPGKSLVIVHYSLLRKTLIIKPETNLALCGPVDVPPEIEQTDHAVMHPDLEPVSPTQDVKMTQIGNIVSVEGIISKASKKS